MLWDTNPRFDAQHGEWHENGPELRIEFSRISQTRYNALTLVLHPHVSLNPCRVAFATSKRSELGDAICDLQCREDTTSKNIGYCLADGSAHRGHDRESIDAIQTWLRGQEGIDAVIWTDLTSNFDSFKDGPKKPFTVENAIAWIESLDPKGRAAAVEYVRRAPNFVRTPLRTALESRPWFQMNADAGG